jgi:hypothetical protein
MAPTWDEERRLGDTIAERQIQRAREAQREMRDHQFRQDALKYWNQESRRQKKNGS